jgi:hypothetical protein
MNGSATGTERRVSNRKRKTSTKVLENGGIELATKKAKNDNSMQFTQVNETEQKEAKKRKKEKKVRELYCICRSPHER